MPQFAAGMGSVKKNPPFALPSLPLLHFYHFERHLLLKDEILAGLLVHKSLHGLCLFRCGVSLLLCGTDWRFRKPARIQLHLFFTFPVLVVFFGIGLALLNRLSVCQFQ